MPNHGGRQWARDVAIACILVFAGIGVVNADTTIYGANAYGLANFVKINLSDGHSEWAGNASFETQAIDRDPVTGNIYYFDWTYSASKFAYWNPTTGSSTTVRTYSPAPGVYPKHMAFAPDNTLYVLDNDDRLYTINKQNGNLTFKGTVTGLETGTLGRTGDFVFAPDGTLYVATYHSLYTLNLNTLAATLLYSNELQEAGGFNVWAGLAYCDGVLYAANIEDAPTRSALFSIDPQTGAVNRLFSLSTYVNDLASCPTSVLQNHPPVMSSIGDKQVSEGESLVFYVDALDPDGDQLTFSVRDLPPGASFDAQSRTFMWVPGSLSAGDHVIDFVATDDGTPARSDTERVTVHVSTSAYVETATISGVANMQDASIANQTYATKNLGGSTLMAVGSVAGTVAARTLLKWDLSSIPEGSVVLSAKMSLYSYNDSTLRNITIDAHRMLRPWIEGTLNNQDRQLDSPASVCWIESGSGLAWQQAGASGSSDRDPSILATSTNTGVGWYEWDLKSAVQHWIDGDWVNDGIVLQSLNEGLENIKYFVPSEDSRANLRPQLVVEYAPAAVTNNPPVLDPIGNKAVGEQKNLTFTVTASDPDNDNLTYSVDPLPPGATFDSGTGVFNWTPSAGQAGVYTLLFTVTDDGVPSRNDTEQITITVGPISVTLSGQSVTSDTMIVSDQYALLNFGGGTNLYIGSAGQLARALIKWNLSSIPAGSTITSATMSLYARSNVAGNALTIDAHRVLRSWVEGTQQSSNRTLDNPDSACWTEYGNGAAWAVAGASGPTDMAPEILASTAKSGTGWFTWDITSAVQHWVDGDWVNNGLALMSHDESQSSAKIFVPSEYQDQNLIPVLNIQYTLP